MTFESDSNSKSRDHKIHLGNNKDINRVLEILDQIINALGEFKGKYDKKFNFSKLASYLRIPKENIDNFISLILNFQEKFKTIFKDYQLKKIVLNHQIYLTLERDFGEKTDLNNNLETQNYIIHITKPHLNHLSDIIYLFQYIKKGKGFDLKTNKTELIDRLIELRKIHPYFFVIEGNNLLYPSELGLELGNLIRSYDKSNKKIENVEIKKYTFIID